MGRPGLPPSLLRASAAVGVPGAVVVAAWATGSLGALGLYAPMAEYSAAEAPPAAPRRVAAPQHQPAAPIASPGRITTADPIPDAAEHGAAVVPSNRSTSPTAEHLPHHGASTPARTAERSFGGSARSAWARSRTTSARSTRYTARAVTTSTGHTARAATTSTGHTARAATTSITSTGHPRASATSPVRTATPSVSTSRVGHAASTTDPHDSGLLPAVCAPVVRVSVLSFD